MLSFEAAVEVSRRSDTKLNFITCIRPFVSLLCPFSDILYLELRTYSWTLANTRSGGRTVDWLEAHCRGCCCLEAAQPGGATSSPQRKPWPSWPVALGLLKPGGDLRTPRPYTAAFRALAAGWGRSGSQCPGRSGRALCPSGRRLLAEAGKGVWGERKPRRCKTAGPSVGVDGRLGPLPGPCALFHLPIISWDSAGHLKVLHCDCFVPRA